MNQPSRVPVRAWVVTFAGLSVNLCLGILYAWSVWKATLKATPEHPAGSPMTGVNEGWTYLSDAQATWSYAIICGFVLAVCIIPGSDPVQADVTAAPTTTGRVKRRTAFSPFPIASGAVMMEQVFDRWFLG